MANRALLFAPRDMRSLIQRALAAARSMGRGQRMGRERSGAVHGRRGDRCVAWW